MVLILTAISFAFTAGLVYMVTSGVQLSGGQTKFETALDGGKSGIDISLQMIEARGNPGIPNLANFALPAENIPVLATNCLAQKLNNATAAWDICDSSLTIDPADLTSYDMSFDLGADPYRYRVYAKIVDTVNGNSGPSNGLKKTGVVLTNPGEITVMSVPYLYTMEILAMNAVNPRERARVSALHLY